MWSTWLLILLFYFLSISQIDDEEENDELSSKGRLEIQLVGKAESTGTFELKNPIDSEHGVFKFTKKEANIGNVYCLK